MGHGAAQAWRGVARRARAEAGCWRGGGARWRLCSRRQQRRAWRHTHGFLEPSTRFLPTKMLSCCWKARWFCAEEPQRGRMANVSSVGGAQAAAEGTSAEPRPVEATIRAQRAPHPGQAGLPRRARRRLRPCGPPPPAQPRSARCAARQRHAGPDERLNAARGVASSAPAQPARPRRRSTWLLRVRERVPQATCREAQSVGAEGNAHFSPWALPASGRNGPPPRHCRSLHRAALFLRSIV